MRRLLVSGAFGCAVESGDAKAPGDDQAESEGSTGLTRPASNNLNTPATGATSGNDFYFTGTYGTYC